MFVRNHAGAKATISAAVIPGGSAIGRNTIIIIVLVVMTAAMMAVGPMQALSQAVQLVKVDMAVVAKGFRVSKLTGRTVVNEKDVKIGEVDDFVVTQDQSLFAVLQIGGFLGLGSRLVVVPYNSLRISDNGRRVELPGATPDELKKLTEFKYPT
jgi:hypothetical protein